MINRSIFRAYDIRGNASKNLTIEVAYNIGFHFAKMNISDSNKRIVVGFDGRLSSPDLYEGLIHGLVEAGAEVSSIGLVPTPVLYYANEKLYPAGSIMITGSHNPKEDNGFKMLNSSGSFYGEKIQLLLQNILSDTKIYEKKQLTKPIYNIKVNPLYIERILKNITINKNLKIVWDPGNGAASNILKELIKLMPNENYTINDKVDGNFPNHHPDPTIPENLIQLQEEVHKVNADFGIAFDGDADRIGVVTKEGRILFGDQLLAIYSKELLERKPGSIIIADVKASKTLFDYIDSIGGKSLMWKTGHSLIKTKMKESRAELAGEMSGHIFFADDYFGFDDALYSSLRLINVISKQDKTIDEIVDILPKAINTPEIRLDVDDEIKFKIVEELKDKLQKENIKYSDIDGIRADSNSGWWLLRASNTQGALIVRCEAESQQKLEEIIKELNSFLSEYKLEVRI